jgi:hypothetical protein
LFYRAQIHKYVPEHRRVYVYVCEGKQNVYQTYAAVLQRYPHCERVLFFVDKDLDDIIGVQWPADPRIFVTEYYSIENYIVTRESLALYFRDFVKVRRVDLDLDLALSRFDEQLREFHVLILPIMSWIVVQKRAGNRVSLHDLSPGELFQVTDLGTFRRPKRATMDYLSRVTQTRPSGPMFRHVKATTLELRRLPAKVYVRGKFEAWWFVEFGRRMIEGLQHVAREAGGSVGIHAPLFDRTFIQLLASGVATPPRLDTFLRFHLSRGLLPSTPKPDAGSKSLLRRVISFFSGS